MVMETVKEKIERDKLRAELFLKERTKSFIIDSRDDYHFCYIISMDENKVKIEEFTGKLKGQKNILFHVDGKPPPCSYVPGLA